MVLGRDSDKPGYHIPLVSPTGLNLDYLWLNQPWARHIKPVGSVDAHDATLEIRLVQQLFTAESTHQTVTLTVPGARLDIHPGAGETLSGTSEFLGSESAQFRDLFMKAVSHALARQGGMALHGASFQHEGFNPLILGDSRSGKSTLTTLALRMGAKVVSDDHLLLSKRDRAVEPAFELESMRADMHLRPPTHDLLPAALAAKLKPAHFHGEQRWILPHRLNPQFQRTTNPNVILCSQVDRDLEKTEIQPMTPPDALAELMRCSSPLFMTPKFPRERDTLMKLMLAMIHVVPAFRLRLGRDLFDKPEQTFQRLTDTLS